MNSLTFEEDIVECLRQLHAGGLILYPTDTIWGIGCDATNTDAVHKIFELKKRPSRKSMIVLMADAREVGRYTAGSDPQIEEYLKNTKRPTTVIYEGALGLAENLTGDDGTIAIRIVRDEFCRHLIKRFRKPLVSTSANISGEESPKCFADISDDIKKGINYTVVYRQQDNQPAMASSLIQFNKQGEPVILRP